MHARLTLLLIAGVKLISLKARRCPEDHALINSFDQGGRDASAFKQLVSVDSLVVPQLWQPPRVRPRNPTPASSLHVTRRYCEVDSEFVGRNSSSPINRPSSNISSLLDSSQFSFIYI